MQNVENIQNIPFNHMEDDVFDGDTDAFIEWLDENDYTMTEVFYDWCQSNDVECTPANYTKHEDEWRPAYRDEDMFRGAER